MMERYEVYKSWVVKHFWPTVAGVILLLIVLTIIAVL